MVPRELYTLGAVQFDTRPLAKLQGELMAKKAAKEEALDKWIFDLQGKIPSGQVRAIDREPFQQKVAQWIKESIALKGRPGAQQSILEGFQGLLADANESKAAGERQQKIAEIKLQNPDKIDEEDLPIIDRMSKSIYDPLFYKKPEIRQPFTLEDFSANIPTWDVGKRKQFIDFALSGVKPAGKANEKSVYDKPSFTDITTYDEVFTPQQIKDVSQKAIAILSDRSGLKTYKQILKEGEQQVPSDQFISLAKAYELVNPGDVMNTPLKVAQAEIALNMIGAKETKTIPKVNREAFAKYQSDLIASRKENEANAPNLLDYDVLGKYEDRKYTVNIPSLGYVGTEVVYANEIPSEDLALITNKGQVAPIKKDGIPKPFFIVKPDGDWEGAKGQVISKEAAARANLDKTSLNEAKRLRQGIIKKGSVYAGLDANGNPIFKNK